MSVNGKEELLLVRGHLYGMPAERQERIEAIAGSLRNILKAGGEDALLAYALVGAEISTEDETKG